MGNKNKHNRMQQPTKGAADSKPSQLAQGQLPSANQPSPERIDSPAAHSTTAGTPSTALVVSIGQASSAPTTGHDVPANLLEVSSIGIGRVQVPAGPNAAAETKLPLDETTKALLAQQVADLARQQVVSWAKWIIAPTTVLAVIFGTFTLVDLKNGVKTDIDRKVDQGVKEALKAEKDEVDHVQRRMLDSYSEAISRFTSLKARFGDLESEIEKSKRDVETKRKQFSDLVLASTNSIPGEGRTVPSINNPSELSGRLARLGSESFGAKGKTVSSPGTQGHDTDETGLQVADTTIFPWRTLCRLEVSTTNGRTLAGTGVIIGRRTILTAGHVVYMRDLHQWARQIRVIPGLNGDKSPFGAITATEFHSVTGWVEDGREDCDYGVVIVPADIDNKIGYMGYAVLNANEMGNLLVNVAGYPVLNKGTLWSARGFVIQATETEVIYHISTFAGESGAPVWYYDPSTGSRTVVAIHVGQTADSQGRAIRITDKVFNDLQYWSTK
jgi:V8-like Glu-specific endopeptidase